MWLYFSRSFVSLLVSVTTLGATPPNPVRVVPHVELSRYLGKWYEIASLPGPFQKNCVGSTATYSLRADGNIDVLSECNYGTFDGKLRSVKGKAWVVDSKTNAKLKVRFFWFVTGDYWIVDLGSDYEYAVVSGPKKKYLWILSRTKKLPNETLNDIKTRLINRGFNLANLRMTPQSDQ